MSSDSLQHVLASPAFAAERRPLTLRNYDVALTRLRQVVGLVSADDATPEHVRSFVDAQLAAGWASQSIRTDVMALIAVLADLEGRGLFDRVRLETLRRLVPARPRRRQLCADFLTAAQVDRYCAGADERAAFLVGLACYTGLRASELAQLRWEDLDLTRRVLQVRGGKTGARQVALCAPAIELLRPRLATGPVLYGTRNRHAGVTGPTLAGWVRDGHSPGAPLVTLTLCRHTRASWWIAAGVPIAIVAKQLGHSVAVCLAHYGGLADAYDPVIERGAAGA